MLRLRSSGVEMPEVFLGLGSNLRGPAKNIQEALARIRYCVAVEQLSSLYRTEPVGLLGQPFFLNAVLRGQTSLGPGELLENLLVVEEEMGRVREVEMGPRTIDIDLLVYDDLMIDTPQLTLPHPRMTERRFVLVPLVEIAPEFQPPGMVKTVSELLTELTYTETVEVVAEANWSVYDDEISWP